MTTITPLNILSSALITAAATVPPAYGMWRGARGAIESAEAGGADPQQTLAQTKRGAQLGALAGIIAGTVLITALVA